ncbi:hypothetical protein [Microbacterium hydrocarbonoxydans]|uniref:hypothetical protein n=1 Tax=Microbacterium hydrocarbonoxydans TaxID=273678 RepID=UPI0007BB649D|nr:hypothetical protein [Microbacterium hydrocarbonoxydans]GAT73360.1 hypothetical protein MHM582_1851 [Microbacterium sp. HM58-2]
MSIMHCRLSLAAASVAALLALSACTAGPASPVPTSTTVPSDARLEEAHPVPPEGRVLGVGTVLDTGGEVQLCLGPVMESYPPQCSGVPLDGWSWTGLDGSETSGDTTWGAYAVYGRYDGERLVSDGEAIMLALFDPMRPEDPTGGVDGTTDEAELTRVQDDISARLGTEALSLWTERGYVWLQVVWDDGTLQDAVDAEYGEDVVLVTSALREVD